MVQFVKKSILIMMKGFQNSHFSINKIIEYKHIKNIKLLFVHDMDYNIKYSDIYFCLISVLLKSVFFLRTN